MRRILYTSILALTAVSAFLIGKYDGKADSNNVAIERLEKTNDALIIEYENGNYNRITDRELEYESYINPANIVDWNTDGKEMAIMTKHDIEMYAYNNYNVYGK